LTCNEGDLGLIPGLGRFPGEGNGHPLQFWPGEFHGLCRVTKSLDTTEQLSLHSKVPLEKLIPKLQLGGN